MRITFSVDNRVVERARVHLRAVGKTLNQEIREHLAHIAGDDKAETEKWIEELQLNSGQGKPDADWRWNRDELYEERLKLLQK